MNINQIATEVFAQLQPADISVLQELADEKDTIQFHHSLGRSIRNEYKLWQPDNPLTKTWHEQQLAGTNQHIIDGVDHHPEHPDHISTLIMYEIWKLARVNI